jgi:energy-coupling factor transporter ATP-binding protein EcfA2
VLEDSGKAGRVELWDVDTFIIELDKSLTRRVVELVRKRTIAAQSERESKFIFGSALVHEVPCRLGTLKPQVHGFPQLKMDGAERTADPVVEVSASIHKRSWTLILGAFGSGKSMLAQRLGLLKQRNVIYVPASELRHPEQGIGGENVLMRMIVQYLSLFEEDDEFSKPECEYLQQLAGPLLGGHLRNHTNEFLLVIDGLDENRVYSSPKGLQILVNQLGCTSCPVILTVRREYFFDHFLTYSGPITEKSRFRPSEDEIRVVELGEWGPTEVLSYIDAAISSLPDHERSGLTEFRKLVENRSLEGRFFLEHPLLLAMTVDLVSDQGSAIVLSDRASLYGLWISRKLFRDYSVVRGVPDGFDNVGLVIDKTIRLMGRVASVMISKGGSTYELVEAVDESAVREIAQTVFEGSTVPTTIYSTASLLEPTQHRNLHGGMELKFFHRSFQEYFLAYFLHAARASADDFPTSVQEFFSELSHS